MINHCGSPIDRDEAGMTGWRNGLKLLARPPNVAIKISDLVAYDHHWTLDSLRPVVRHCIDCFGTERAMFASDFPVAGLHASFDEVYGSFKTIVSDLTPEEQRALFHDTALRLYRLAADGGSDNGRGGPVVSIAALRRPDRDAPVLSGAPLVARLPGWPHGYGRFGRKWPANGLWHEAVGGQCGLGRCSRP